MIHISGLAEVIIDIIIRYYRVLKLIVMNQGIPFTSKFCSLLYYFLEIKKSYVQPSALKQIVKPRDRTA